MRDSPFFGHWGVCLLPRFVRSSFGAISGFFVEGNASVCNVALFISGVRCYRLSA